MPAERQAEACIVGDDLFAFARRLERRQALRRRRIERRAACGAGRDPVRQAPVAGERLQRAGRGQAAQIAFIQFQIKNAAVRLAGGNALALLLGKPADHAQAQAQGVALERAVPVAHLHVGRPHLDPVPARILHQLGRRVEAHRLAVEQRGAERRRVMAFDPGRDIDEQREACRVRFRKAVLAEAQDLAGRSPRRTPRYSRCAHPALQPFLELLQAAGALPRRHRAPQPVGLARREVGRDHGELHHLLLEDGHAQGSLQDPFDRRARIDDGFLLATPPQVRVHHAALDRPGPHDRHLDHQVVEALRTQARQHAHLRARLDLEHADVSAFWIMR